MDDSISRQAALKAMINAKSNVDVTLVDAVYARGFMQGQKVELNAVLDAVENLPSAQPERKEGEWIRITENAYVCSLCNTKAHLIGYDAPSDYCHGCGAKMVI